MDRAAHGRRRRWRRQAERANDAFGLVFLLVIVNYVLLSLLGDQGWAALPVCASSSAASVVALSSARAPVRFVRYALWLALLSLALATLAALGDGTTWLNLTSAIQICLLVAAMAAMLRRVVMSPRVGSRAILGALSVYAVLGILFTFVYSVVDRVQGGAFFEGQPDGSGGDFLFFSYTTLTTTGFGDLVPAGQPGRMLAGLEMLVGQIFLVTLVAGLVSLWRPGEALRRREGGAAEAAPPRGRPAG